MNDRNGIIPDDLIAEYFRANVVRKPTKASRVQASGQLPDIHRRELS
jgi:hypothetical protein